jgi:hypothetical protein
MVTQQGRTAVRRDYSDDGKGGYFPPPEPEGRNGSDPLSRCRFDDGPSAPPSATLAAVRKAAQQAKARGDRKEAIRIWAEYHARKKAGNGPLNNDHPSPVPPEPRPAKGHNGRRQKTAGRAGDRRFRERNRPPEGEGWVWFTYEMLISPAWIAMPPAARQVVEAIAVAHMKRAGLKNGELCVTYDNIAARGVRRQSIPEAIKIAQALGWIEVTFAGGASYGSGRRPSEYALTWLPKCDGAPATYRWVQIKAEQAKAIVAAITKRRRGRVVVP